MVRFLRPAVVALPAAALCGCGLFEDPSFPIRTPMFDAVVDVSNDTPDERDARPDAQPDVSADVQPDVAPDDGSSIDAPDVMDADATIGDDVADVADVIDRAEPDVALDDGVRDVPVDVPIDARPDITIVDAIALDATPDDVATDVPCVFETPTLRAPYTGSVVRSLRPVLAWSGRTCGYPSIVEVSRDRTFLTGVQTLMVTAESHVTPSALEPGRTWFWRVSLPGAGPRSVTGEFRVALEPRTTPTSGRVDGAVYGTTLDGNADGFADLAIGSPGRIGDAGAVFGRVYVYPGGAAFATDTRAPTILTASDGDSASRVTFGARITGLGDVNNDGYPDLLVASRGASAWVFRGGPDGWTNANVYPAINVLLTAGDAPEVPPIAGVGDFDRDGFGDVMVATPTGVSGTGGRGMPPNGSVVFLRGTPGGLVLGAAGGPILTAARYGYSLAPAGDLDADGHPDFVVGSPGLASTTPGEVYVVPGASSLASAMRTLVSGATPTSLFGARVAAAGDVDGDGRSEFFVGQQDAPSLWFATLIAGHLNARPTDPVVGSTGVRAVPVGDIDADGLDEVVRIVRGTVGVPATLGFSVLHLGPAAFSRVVSLPISTITFTTENAGSPGDVDGDTNDDAFFVWRDSAGIPFVTLFKFRGLEYVDMRRFAAPSPSTELDFGAAIGMAY